MSDPVRFFELYRVPLDELRDWLEARGLAVCEHSVNWGERIVAEVRDDQANDTRTVCQVMR